MKAKMMVIRTVLAAAVAAALWATRTCDPGTAVQTGCAAAATVLGGGDGKENR